MKKSTIKVTVMLENSFWIGIFERNEEKIYAVARKIFGKEPTDPELYQFITHNYHELKFTEPQNFKLIIKRKNYKRMQRDVKKEVDKAKKSSLKTTHAQETLRIELEKNKKAKKTLNNAEKDAKSEKTFQIRQAKKKQKHRGH